jgi:uncharacterized membrane-anchored protein
MRIVKGLGKFAAVAAVWAIALGCARAAPSAEESRQAWRDAAEAATRGPADVPLAGEAVLHLPDGEVFIPRRQSLRLLAVMGNPGDAPDLQGMIMSRDDKSNWFMVVEWKAAGYVKDDDAKDWNADDLLKSYREGTAESNKERARAGVPELDVTGWAEPPRYDAKTQRLAWAMTSREVGAPATAVQSVNYNTYALGRDGYFEMNLVAGLDELAALKPVAAQQLAALDYNPGKKYADFNAKTDHVAEYGLAALVVGVAAKKLGLIALGAAFFAKFAKVILIALAAFGGGFLKFFKRSPKPAPQPLRTFQAQDTQPPSAPAPAPAPAPVRDLPPIDVDLPDVAPREPAHDPYAPTIPMPLHGPDGHGEPSR